jgi:hypothetical protein
MVNIAKQFKIDDIQKAYISLDSQKRSAVRTRAIEIGHDVSSCEFYGIKYNKIRQGDIHAAAMYELGLLQ